MATITAKNMRLKTLPSFLSGDPRGSFMPKYYGR